MAPFSWGCATQIRNIEEKKEREFGGFGAGGTGRCHLYLSVQSWFWGQCVMGEIGWPWRGEASAPVYQAALSPSSHLLTQESLCRKPRLAMSWG